MNKWDNLPNAKYIDRIIASLNVNSELWNTASTVIMGEAEDAAWNTAWNAATRPVIVSWNAACGAARNAIGDAAWDAAKECPAWNAARNAITALIAYDDCAYMLDSDPGELAMLAAFGDPRAILLLPACIAFSKITQ